MEEVWLSIPSFSDYMASSLGRIKRRQGLSRSRRDPNACLKDRFDCKQRYRIVNLHRDGRQITKHVHHLVAEAFLGPRPLGHDINHIDGVKTNNHADNLEYVTPSENRKHAYAIGLQPRHAGSNSPMAKLSDDDVREITRMLDCGTPQKEIASKFSIHTSVVSAICTGSRWGHLTGRVYKKTNFRKGVACS